MKNLIVFSFIISINSYAGGGSNPQTWEEFFVSLGWPFFNVALLASLLFWKLKTPVKDFFKNKSESIAEIMERANVKAKEAEMMMQMQRKKIDGMHSEIQRIHSDAQVEIETYQKFYVKDIDQRIEKLKTDAALKIEAEKKQLTDQLNNLLLDEVLKKTKETIKNNKELGEKATSNALEGLR